MNCGWALGSFKCAYQRVTKGYCYRDLWDFFDYLVKIIHNGLLEFADKTEGYPDGMEFDEWQEYLRKTVKLFYRSLDENVVYKNEHWDDDKLEFFDKDKWFKRELEIGNQMEADKNKAFDMLKERFAHLWW